VRLPFLLLYSVSKWGDKMNYADASREVVIAWQQAREKAKEILSYLDAVDRDGGAEYCGFAVFSKNNRPRIVEDLLGCFSLPTDERENFIKFIRETFITQYNKFQHYIEEYNAVQNLQRGGMNEVKN
jgi:hypothetical protein